MKMEYCPNCGAREGEGLVAIKEDLVYCEKCDETFGSKKGTVQVDEKGKTIFDEIKNGMKGLSERIAGIEKEIKGGSKDEDSWIF